MPKPRMKKRRAKRAKRPISLEDFRKNLELVFRKNPELQSAWQRATKDGCTDRNLIVSLYYYSFGDVLVIRPRRAGRKSVLGRLAALKTRFEGLGTQTD
jgi:hypothetical protein